MLLGRLTGVRHNHLIRVVGVNPSLAGVSKLATLGLALALTSACTSKSAERPPSADELEAPVEALADKSDNAPDQKAESKAENNANAIPQMARNFDPDMAARQAGILGVMQQESGHFLASPYGGSFAVGNDDSDVWGGLTGSEVGQAYGVGGLGLVGTGRGGGGVGMSYGAQFIPTTPPPSAAGEDYEKQDENPFKTVKDAPLSTFSIDVDTASYSNMRRFVTQWNKIPPIDAVRIEEFLNYFDYNYDGPHSEHPFSVDAEVANCPWNPKHRLVHVGIQGRTFDAAQVPPRNLVFLLDVSGSMNSTDKLPLLKRGLTMLTKDLKSHDRVAIVVYAGAAGVVLPSTPGNERKTILGALERLSAGGSTNGGEGIERAFAIAQEHFIKGGVNRVILGTDGDFNVGTQSRGALEDLIVEKRKSGVYLTVLGFGSGNLKDATMETLADKGNGNYAYIDSEREAHKVLVREAGSTIVTIAKDVKLQVEFNPALVSSYRLIGYENRVLADRDFNDDKKDAGEIGAGHSVTALYEIIPPKIAANSEVDALKYQTERGLTEAATTGELMTVKVRYKPPKSDTSTLLSQTVQDAQREYDTASEDFRFSAGVALFGMLLRESPERSQGTLELVSKLAGGALGTDPHGDRKEFLQLVDKVKAIGLDNRASTSQSPGIGIGFGGRGKRVPRVRQAKAQVKGALDRDIIRRIVRAHINEVRSCYNQGLSRDPSLQGRVVIQFTIADGKVPAAVVQNSTLKDQAVGNCVAKAMRRWKFPKSQDGKNVLVTYPFLFSPG